MDEYVAFDSFQGFPEGTTVAEHPLYKAGHVKTQRAEFLRLLESYGQVTKRVRCIEGFYSETLNAALHDELKKKSLTCNLVTVDCNLYESYRDVLAFIDGFLKPGTVVYLDDFNSHRGQPKLGPKRAWYEYLRTARWHFEDFLSVGWSGKSFICCDK
jgi:hypothetical protein